MPKTRNRVSYDEPSFLQRVQQELNLNQSYLSLVLGLLIVIVAGVLIFNYFKGSSSDLIPAQQSDRTDVSPDKLPGKYTVKEGDTLYSVAEKYYKDGYKFQELVKANGLENENTITVGQVLEIPKLEGSTPSPMTEVKTAKDNGTGTGGAINATIWGERINGESYTVVEGDWLSTIAGRAYGDIMAYDRIAKANNIVNPDLIFPGQQLKLPR